MKNLPGFAGVLLAALLSTACGKSVGDKPAQPLSVAQNAGLPPSPAPSTQAPSKQAMAALGKKMFFDISLSASGRMSCATCHSPAHAYGPPNDLPAQFGGPDLKRQGNRAVPSLAYTLNRTPRWAQEIPSKPEEQSAEKYPPFGGFTWDGRVDTLREQATIPLLDPNEMANITPEAVVRKIAGAPYADEFRQVFGEHIFDDVPAAFAQAAQAIEYFELTDASFHPYSSKYDAYLDGKVQLSAQEKRGLELFDDRDSGNCAFCHTSRAGADRSHPLFTNYQFEALGAPRNPRLAVNKDPNYYDMGLCGPIRGDQFHEIYCGMFKTPTLRNVARRGVFFHNGYFRSLEEVLRFYVQRDTHPGKWYPRKKNGEVDKFNDLPEQYRVNVDIIDVPLNRKLGDKPVWNEQDIADVVAFLNTLTDGYVEP